MKKLLLLFSAVLFFAACDNELDIIEEWKDIPIVYAILDPSDTAHYIRVEKAFLDDAISAIDLAKNPDSIYYKNIQVTLTKEFGTAVQLEKVDGNLEGYPREEGLFAEAPNYLYKVLAEDLQLAGNEVVFLDIIRENIDEPVRSSVKTIESFNFVRPRPDDPEKLNLNYANHITIRWNYAENAINYEVYVITHYDEKIKGEPDDLYVPKEDIWRAANEVEDNSVLLNSKDYYTHLGSSIPTIEGVERRFNNIEFRVLGVGQELNDYFAIGKANLGITASQEIPQYTNISNALGVFSSTMEISLPDLNMISTSLDTLYDGIYTKHLNFVK